MPRKVDSHPGLWRLQRAMCLVVGLVVRVFFGLRVRNTPRLDGAFLLAPNHLSFLDPLILQLALPRHVTYLMDGPIYRNKTMNWFYRFWGVIPIPSSQRSVGALKEALRAVRKGEVVGIFPEGRISVDGKLQPGQGGVSVLMQKAAVPVVPVAIFGTRNVLPRAADFPRAGRLMVVYGEPIFPIDDSGDRRAAAEELKNKVMAAIAALQERWQPQL